MTAIVDSTTYFSNLSGTLKKLPFTMIDEIVETLLLAYDEGRMVYAFGNGGSAALASHLACDLGKGTVNGTGKRFRVMALTDNVPLMTAWANDSKYDEIFSEQMLNFVQPGDVAFAISGSGNSPNVLRALKVARDAGAITVGLTGFKGGKLKDLCDQCLIVDSDNMQIIEDLHVCVMHSLFTVFKHKISNHAVAAGAA